MAPASCSLFSLCLSGVARPALPARTDRRVLFFGVLETTTMSCPWPCHRMIRKLHAVRDEYNKLAHRAPDRDDYNKLAYRAPHRVEHNKLAYRGADETGPASDESAWILGPETTSLVLLRLFVDLSIGKRDGIFIQGVGVSTIAEKLRVVGYSSIQHGDLSGVSSDAVQSRSPLERKYKVIIDPSTLDELFRKRDTTRQKQVIEFYKQHLTDDDGVLICISMFHRYVASQNVFDRDNTLHFSIAQTRGCGSTGRTTGKHIQAAAIYVNFKNIGDVRKTLVKSKQHTIPTSALSAAEAARFKLSERSEVISERTYTYSSIGSPWVLPPPEQDESEGFYFSTQNWSDVNCFTLTVNNLLGACLVSREDLLKMTTKNTQDQDIQMCAGDLDRGGIACQNMLVQHLLNLLKQGNLNASPKIQKFFKGSEAFEWKVLRMMMTDQPFSYDDFDSFFKMFEKRIIGVFGNRTHTAGIGHAVCIRREDKPNGKLWLLDALEKTRHEVAIRDDLLPSKRYNIVPYVVVMSSFNTTENPNKCWRTPIPDGAEVMSLE